jgi:hypothetical protein
MPTAGRELRLPPFHLDLARAGLDDAYVAHTWAGSSQRAPNLEQQRGLDYPICGYVGHVVGILGYAGALAAMSNGGLDFFAAKGTPIKATQRAAYLTTDPTQSAVLKNAGISVLPYVDGQGLFGNMVLAPLVPMQNRSTTTITNSSSTGTFTFTVPLIDYQDTLTGLDIFASTLANFFIYMEVVSDRPPFPPGGPEFLISLTIRHDIIENHLVAWRKLRASCQRAKMLIYYSDAGPVAPGDPNTDGSTEAAIDAAARTIGDIVAPDGIEVRYFPTFTGPSPAQQAQDAYDYFAAP